MTIRLNYIAPVDHTGYACAAAQYLRLLTCEDASVHFQPLRVGPGLGLWYEPVDSSDVPSELQAFGNVPLMFDAPTILHTVPEYYPLLIEWLRKRGVTGPILGMTVWETSRLPQHWPALLNAMDGIIVPSEWNVEVFRSSGVTAPLYCLPHASEFNGQLPASLHTEEMLRRLPNLEGKFVFYSIGVWSRRKGNDLLLKAFLHAFADQPEVLLVLKTTPRSIDPPPSRWKRFLNKLVRKNDPVAAARTISPSQIFLLTDELSPGEIAALHGLGKCFVTCTRGEGWGIGLYEAVLFDKPVVAPDKGGHRAYIHSDNYMGLYQSSWTQVKVPGSDRSYTSDQQWIEPDWRAAAKTMRAVYDQRLQAAEQAQHLGSAKREAFSEEAIRGCLSSIISEQRKS